MLRLHVSKLSVECELVSNQLSRLQEEEKALRDEIVKLQAQVAVLKSKGLPTDAAIAADPVLQESTAKMEGADGHHQEPAVGDRRGSVAGDRVLGKGDVPAIYCDRCCC